MAKYDTFRELTVWQKSMLLAQRIHAITSGWPPNEMFGLGTQLRRASVSIPANVVEGFSRRSRRTYRRHVAIALGSEAEAQTLIELARRLGLITAPEFAELMDLATETGKMLTGLWKSLRLKAATTTSCYAFVFALLGTAFWKLF